MTANYIKRIEIDSLWRGTRHIVWDLRPGVNVLSGINGVGKSTILRKTIRRLTQGKEELERDYNSLGVHLTFVPEEADSVRFDVIRGVDRPLVSADILNKVMEARLTTELDWQLYQLQRRYLDYQVSQSNRIVGLFTAADPEAQQKAAEIAQEKAHFQDLVDQLFEATGKKIDRTSNREIYALPPLVGRETDAHHPAHRARRKPRALCPAHGRTGDQPTYRMAAATARSDHRTQSQCTSHPHDPLPGRHHERMDGLRHRR